MEISKGNVRGYTLGSVHERHGVLREKTKLTIRSKSILHFRNENKMMRVPSYSGLRDRAVCSHSQESLSADGFL